MKSTSTAAITSNVADRSHHNYEPVPSSERLERESRHSNADSDEEDHIPFEHHSRNFKKINLIKLVSIGMGAIGMILFFWLAFFGRGQAKKSCDSIDKGFTCSSSISHYWGQYSPFFAVPSEISIAIPDNCQITFAQVLSRHGARDPTSSKTAAYAQLINRIHLDTTSYSEPYSFVKNYSYTLGANQLSVFGQQQMINSGIKFYNRYRNLAKTITPFVRSTDQDRVLESAQNWTQGFHSARIYDLKKDASYPYNIVTIPEATGLNNTLSHGLCTGFEKGFDSTIGNSAQTEWMSVFAPRITSRLNANLPGANITDAETIYMMDLCPFNTVADLYGTMSPFCNLFTEGEWKAYDYYQSIGKYYGYSWGNPLGATQGVGFTNELIARLTNSTVEDYTSTNSTLDNNPATFPLGGEFILYADFSHDNDLTGIFSALGLYNATAPLLNTTIESTEATKGYSAAWTVPFAARAYFEKMRCAGESQELIRVIVNDRVLPLETCDGDKLGRCKLTAFVDSLSFARNGGDWGACFI